MGSSSVNSTARITKRSGGGTNGRIGQPVLSILCNVNRDPTNLKHQQRSRNTPFGLELYHLERLPVSLAYTCTCFLLHDS